MKVRLAIPILFLFLFLFLFAGALFRLAIVRSGKEISRPLPGVASGSRSTARPASPGNAPEAERNPEIPEEATDASTGAVAQGAIPPRTPVADLTAEEAPSADPETAGRPSVPLPPAIALENLRGMFRQYSLRLGGNPVGNNREITAALNGENPRQVVFLNPDDGARMNARGELVDPWNSPYFFHQLSRTVMEIRSAGSDGRMWTTDDLVIQ